MTEEEKTQQNPEEEETPEEPEEGSEQTPKVEKETPKKETKDQDEPTDREKRLYARMKKAEEEAKAAKEELQKAKPNIDVDAILEIQEAIKGLDSTEVAELKNRAKILNKPLSEARKDENFVLWQKAHQEKVAQDNIPEPTTKQSTEGGEKPYSEMTLDEKNEYFAKRGFLKKFPTAKSRK